jgi:hypothetical protein
MMESRALLELVLSVVGLFYGSRYLGGYLRVAIQLGDRTSIKMLAFLVVVALAGGLLGAYQAGVGVARARQTQMMQQR